ncbi:MAG: septation protein A [Alphaproteobacteria bacterium]|nr:septation protein A [Alphaproteobacteria bacterium]
MRPSLRFALDMGPLLIFFLGYRFAGLMAATAALVAFTMLSLAITYALEKRISPMPLVSGIAVAFFGGMTLWLNDELFIKIKPTLVNLLFAAILLGGLYFKKPMLKYVLESAVQLTDEGWRILSRRWGFFFVFLAVLNEIIWRHFPTDFWVNFKVFGMFSCTVIFMLSQIPLMKRFMIEEAP